ncbi:hypothetical protein H6F95_00200 [Cyanobacteria bacterium FACHB-471]|nr:hypothetical protein [Cyanobacteria bacterium FACHB-471]
MVSHRPQPHICSVVLSPELTQQLIQRSRAERTTVHGAISAAFLLTLTQQDVSNDAMFTPGQCAIAAILADAINPAT